MDDKEINVFQEEKEKVEEKEATAESEKTKNE